MTSDRRLPVPVLVLSLVTPLTMFALGAASQPAEPDTRARTAIEQALIERRCATSRPAGAPEADSFQDCLSNQLLSLRTDFGRDLTRLSEPERKTIDTVCSGVRDTRGRDAYVDCLSGQLTSLHNRRIHKNPEPAAVATIAAPQVIATSVVPAPAASVAPQNLSLMWIGGALVVVLVAGGGVLVARKTKRVQHKCRTCGTDVSGAGDLCQKCRHEAAEALRHAAAQRAELQRAEEDRERRLHDHEEERRQQKTRQRQDDEMRLQQEQANREEEGRREEALRQQEEDARRQREAEAAAPDVDPYAILDIPHDASPDVIRAAYEQARSKYAADQVAHLGVDIQEHFKAKAEAVELAYQQAYQKLTG